MQVVQAKMPIIGMSSENGVCFRDKEAYEALAQRWKLDTNLKRWWHGLSSDEQVEWYRQQQTFPVRGMLGGVEQSDAEDCVDSCAHTVLDPKTPSPATTVEDSSSMGSQDNCVVYGERSPREKRPIGGVVQEAQEGARKNALSVAGSVGNAA